jgi:hypothetical protein
VRGKVGAGEDDGARIRMAGAQIVKKFLAQIGNGIDVEHEEVRLGAEDEALGAFQRRRDVDLARRRGFVEGVPDFLGQIEVWLEDKNAPRRFGGAGGLGRRRFVHNRSWRRGRRQPGLARHALSRDACFRRNGKQFFLVKFGDGLPPGRRMKTR